MPISMKCPHCERAFKLKDELAGKRVTCSKCRKMYSVPTARPEVAAVPSSAVATPAADPESLALSVLGEETAPKPEAVVAADAPGETIAYKCQFCDHVNHFEVRMEGKNAPCAGVPRILKVPMRIKENAKDWRTVAAKPTLARQDTDQPEGAWGAAHAQAVSVEALKEAAAAADDEPERSWGKRIILGMAVFRRNRIDRSWFNRRDQTPPARQAPTCDGNSPGVHRRKVRSKSRTSENQTGTGRSRSHARG